VALEGEVGDNENKPEIPGFWLYGEAQAAVYKHLANALRHEEFQQHGAEAPFTMLLYGDAQSGKAEMVKLCTESLGRKVALIDIHNKLITFDYQMVAAFRKEVDALLAYEFEKPPVILIRNLDLLEPSLTGDSPVVGIEITEVLRELRESRKVAAVVITSTTNIVGAEIARSGVIDAFEYVAMPKQEDYANILAAFVSNYEKSLNVMLYGGGQADDTDQPHVQPSAEEQLQYFDERQAFMNSAGELFEDQTPAQVEAIVRRTMSQRALEIIEGLRNPWEQLALGDFARQVEATSFGIQFIGDESDLDDEDEGEGTTKEI
jgi:hypothetical protein